MGGRYRYLVDSLMWEVSDLSYFPCYLATKWGIYRDI